MQYAEYTREGNVHVTSVAPIDPRIVRLMCSIRVPGYRTTYSETITTLTAALGLSGTKKYNKEDLDVYFKRHGLTISISSSNGCVHYTITTRKVELSSALSILEELLATPHFTKSEFATKVHTSLEENRESHDNAKRIAEILFRNALYPHEAPLALDTLKEGSDILKQISASDVRTLQQDIQKGEWFITVVGDSDSSNKVHTFAKKWTEHAALVPHNYRAVSLHPPQQHFVTVPGKTNVELRIGNIIPITPRDLDYTPLIFGLSVLGKPGSFSGRLMSTVREKEGLTYGIYAIARYTDIDSTGHWYITTFFTGKDLSQGLEATKREVEKIVEKGITARELATFKEIMRNQYLIAHESNSSRLSFYHGSAFTHEHPDDIKQKVDRIEKLERQEVNRSLKQYIDPKQLIITGAGPVTTEGIGLS